VKMHAHWREVKWVGCRAAYSTCLTLDMCDPTQNRGVSDTMMDRSHDNGHSTPSVSPWHQQSCVGVCEVGNWECWFLSIGPR